MLPWLLQYFSHSYCVQGHQLTIALPRALCRHSVVESASNFLPHCNGVVHVLETLLIVPNFVFLLSVGVQVYIHYCRFPTKEDRFMYGRPEFL